MSADRAASNCSSHQLKFRNGRAFTLIELLIVVAIIALLAAIAVPNFLEAQTRAKVSRAQSDLRTIATALEAYRTDYNRYYLAEFFDPLAGRLSVLTTPVAYMTSIIPDPFYKEDRTQYAGNENMYCYASGNLYGGPNTLNSNYAASIYSLASRGPDGHFFFGVYCMAHPTMILAKGLERGSYDPTNGTISEGDIIRVCSSAL
jgi:prepilin-type N-terminal cleavage/methylation domain-containing protein